MSMGERWTAATRFFLRRGLFSTSGTEPGLYPLSSLFLSSFLVALQGNPYGVVEVDAWQLAGPFNHEEGPLGIGTPHPPETLLRKMKIGEALDFQIWNMKGRKAFQSRGRQPLQRCPLKAHIHSIRDSSIWLSSYLRRWDWGSGRRKPRPICTALSAFKGIALSLSQWGVMTRFVFG